MNGFGELWERHASRGVLVDTNLVILFGVGLYDPQFIPKFKRTRHYTRDDFDLLSRFICRFHRVIITPHILAEVSNLAIHGRDERHAGPVVHLLDVLRSAKEFHIAKDDILDQRYLPYLGITDTGIVQLARRERYLVLTDDRQLASSLAELLCDVVDFDHLRTAARFD